MSRHMTVYNVYRSSPHKLVYILRVLLGRMFESNTAGIHAAFIFKHSCLQRMLALNRKCSASLANKLALPSPISKSQESEHAWLLVDSS